MLCVQAHHQDLRREVVHHVLQQRAQAAMPQRQGPWWRALGHVLSVGWSGMCTLRRPQHMRQADGPEALWDKIVSSHRTKGQSCTSTARLPAVQILHKNRLFKEIEIFKQPQDGGITFAVR